VSFIANLMDESIPFVSVELGREVDAFVVHLWASFAQAEVSKISQRTREALAQKKLEGVVLGNPRIHEAQPLAWAARKKNADVFALSLKPIVEGCKQAGMTTYTAIAKHLNQIKQPTRMGKAWQPQSVKNLVRRIDVLAAA
jgi:DNA invertase Pin-like site-specific DNA recombinase